MCSSHNHIIAVLAYHRSINTTTKYGGHILNHKTPFLMESILIIRRTSGRERKVETCNNESAARGDKRYQQLEGAINDCLIGEQNKLNIFLAILNLSDEYKQWSKLSPTASEKLSKTKSKLQLTPSWTRDGSSMPQITHRYNHFNDQLIM
ncbi:uncharacterized protein LOC114323009 isoform X1 [Camellia sinensis]|uniref:uncharacterized protein LOC114323009 isoform X1 n=1 Tax=Camellia sinensis TaxID=4442 RepID=UPI001035F812|nr:uncharacterized protein LOC114323009 isoform X1 [Camellia sinensis]